MNDKQTALRELLLACDIFRFQWRKCGLCEVAASELADRWDNFVEAMVDDAVFETLTTPQTDDERDICDIAAAHRDVSDEII